MFHPMDQLNRQAFAVLELSEQDKEDTMYWRDKTPHQRLEGLEATRRIVYGEDATSARLQHVFEITQQA